MAGIDAVKDLVKPPFANYDIVVYFGCGLFSLPFMMHYVGRLRMAKTSFNFNIDPPFVSTLITTLTLLFSVYILGHIIAYVSSQIIEKTMDSLFGKSSTVVLMGASAPRDDFRKIIGRQLKDGISKHLAHGRLFSSIVRFAAHAPVIPFYLVVGYFEVYGYYRSRISGDVIDSANSILTGMAGKAPQIAVTNEWFKPLEAIVANNNATATARMYNYLVISGLFRSVCLILLCSSWFEVIYLVMKIFKYEPPLGLLMFGNTGVMPHVISYLAICLVYLFALFSYLKFQRRYVEDAIFAFVYAKA